MPYRRIQTAPSSRRFATRAPGVWPLPDIRLMPTGPPARLPIIAVMPRRMLALAGCLLIPASILAQSTNHPDFNGLWTTYAEPGAARGGGPGCGGGPPLPMTEEAQKKVAAYRALIGTSGDTPGGFCLGTGMPGSMLGSGGYPMEILQRPEQINITYEAHNEVRRVYLGDRIVPAADRVPGRNG